MLDIVFDRVHSCLLGVRIGDAMGMPWETWNRKRIQKQWDGGWSDPQQRNIADTQHLKMYDTTDDWQLTVAIAKSIIRMGMIDIEDIALAHVEAYRESTAGWGGTTKTALKEYDRWFASGKTEGWDPLLGSRAFSSMCGSGVVMKIAPVAIFHALRQTSSTDLRKDVYEIARLTHTHPLAARSANDYAQLIYRIIQSWGLQSALPMKDENSAVEHAYSLKMKWVLDVCQSGSFLHPDEAAIILGSSFHCYDIVPAAIYCGLRYNDPWQAVEEAIRIGGDTDTTASLVGALSGARNPGKWKTSLLYPRCYDDTEAFAREFYAACLR